MKHIEGTYFEIKPFHNGIGHIYYRGTSHYFGYVKSGEFCSFDLIRQLPIVQLNELTELCNQWDQAAREQTKAA